jgi:hypothetical protein
MRGNNVMAEYYRDLEAAAAAVRDGWFHSGDLAAMHVDRYIEIRDATHSRTDQADRLGHGAGLHLVDLQELERHAGPDDVQDGIDPADLMEVDLLGRQPVQPTLHLGQPGKGGQGSAPGGPPR